MTEQEKGTSLAVVEKAMHPLTGEVYEIATCDDANLAELLDAFKEARSKMTEVEGAIKQEALRRMDKAARWTIGGGGYKVTGESPNLVEYDADALLLVLRQLLADELIAREAAAAALGQETKLKVKANGVKALLKLGGAVAEAIKSTERPKSGNRSVSVKRAGD